MLERATACIEPAAHHLLRRLQTPTRSKRVLLQSFWRHGGDDLAGVLWWPEYLRNVRCSSQARLQAQRDILRDVGCSRLPSLDGAGKYLGIALSGNLVQAAKLAVELQPRLDGSRQDRSYSWSCARFQEPIAEPDYSPDKKDYAENSYGSLQGNSSRQRHYTPHSSPTEDRTESLHMSAPENTTDRLQYHTVQVPKPGHIYATPEELESLLQERGDAFEEAWRLFISLRRPTTFARGMLQYLSKSKRRIDHERAVRAYKMLSTDRKTERTYADVMRIANSRRSQRLALEINHEALSQSLGSKSSKIFFAYLVQNNLWNTLAKALDDFREIRKKHRLYLASKDKESTGNSDIQSKQEHRLWKRVWADVDQMTQLPEKVLSLMRRIESASPVSPLREPRVRRLVKELMYRVVQSPRVMAVITGSGFLSLFQKSAQIEVLWPNHYYQAIRTLLAMVGSRNRSPLAALAYRNLRFRFRDTQIPRWIYGSLISIFTDAGQPSHSMRFLLDEFAAMHGRPDQRAYQKVMVACARLGDVKGVHAVFKQFSENFGVPQDLGFITPLLYVHARIGDVAGTKAQFDRLTTDFDVRPDTYCWNILLASHTRANDSTGAFEVFHDMQRLAIKADAYSFGTLMGICARNGDTEGVHKLVDMARKENITGTTAMVNTLVHSYCLNDEPESAKDLVETATNMKLEGSPTRMWNTLLRYYAFQSDSEAVLRVQERMRELSVQPDDMTYAALMTALVVIGRTEDAAKILRSLHFSEQLTATLFHYSIVLHGYAMEGNRDMVSIIYNEILERFPRPSVSARLAVLHAQTARDKTVWRARQARIAPASKMLHLPRAIDFLANTLLETTPADLATKDPQPGLQRRTLTEALPSIYMEFLINMLNSAGAFDKAEKILARCLSLIETSYLSVAEKTKPSIQLLTAHMIGCIRKREFAKVENCWNLILARALPPGQPLTPQRESDPEDPLGSPSPPRPSSIVDINLPYRDKVFGLDANFSAPSEGAARRALPSQRYLLAAPLTHYMHALGAQKLVALVPSLVQKLESAGFALTSKNYNTYIQVLTQSVDPHHQLLAFKIFEDKLLPNMPPWSVLRRGKWTPQPVSDRDDENLEADPDSDPEPQPEPEPIPRRLLEKFRPWQLIPTYYTMVFLGSALMRFQRRSAKGEDMGLRQLQIHAPGTVEAVLALPYLRDRPQGILLRGRKIKGDLVKRPRKPPKPDRAGLRGSKSPLDHVPINHPYQERSQEIAYGDSATKGAEFILPSLWDAQVHSGEILREPAVMERTGQLEFNQQFRSRLQRDGHEKSALIGQMRVDANREPMVSDTYFGEPHIASTNFKIKDFAFRREHMPKSIPSSEAQPVVLDQARERIERVWEAQRDGRTKHPALSSVRFRVGMRRYPREQRLALARSKVPPEILGDDRSTDTKQLGLFQPPIPPTRRQSKAFDLNKRAVLRRKLFRRREATAYNRPQHSG